MLRYMSLRRPVRVLVPCVLLALLAMTVAGCGGSASKDRTLSKREYIAQANDLQHDAATTFAKLDGRTVATPATARAQLLALDRLIKGFDALRPPNDWRDEHATLRSSLSTMRQAMAIVARASPRNTRAITSQLQRYATAQRAFEGAVHDINASR
jgi:hypothetical protein